MGHHTCCNQQKVKRGLWSPEEDEKLIRYISSHGYGCWSEVPDKAGLQRCGKSCRLRWINYLRPDIRRGRFSQEEEKLIISLHEAVGNRWAQIASHLPGRTDNEIKNYWNSWIKKKIAKPSRVQQPLSTTFNEGQRLFADTKQHSLHYELLKFNPNTSISERTSGTCKPLTTTLDDHQSLLSYPSLKNNFMFDTSSMISSHAGLTTPMSSLANLDLARGFTFTDDNQKVPEVVVTQPPLPPHSAIDQDNVEMGLNNNSNNNYLPALVDGDHHQPHYDQCLEKYHSCNNNSIDDELSLWDVSPQCPNFLFWDNVIEGLVVDEVTPFDPSLVSTTTYLSSAYPSSSLEKPYMT